MPKPKEKRKLTVKELKEIEPKLEVYELSPFRKYIVIVKKSPIIGIDNIRVLQTAKEVARCMIAANVPCQMVVGIDDEVKFLEVS